MKKLQKIASFILLAGLFSCQQKPLEVYISPSGDDSAAGGKEEPVLTLEKAMGLTASMAGKREVNIILEDGIYYLDKTVIFKPEHSGSAKHPVIIRAENEGRAIISGGQKLKLSWEPFRDGIYKAKIRWKSHPRLY